MLQTVMNWTPTGLGFKGLRWVWGRSRRLAVAAVVVVVVVKVRAHVQRQQRRKQWAAAGKDVVVLHEFGRGRRCPSLSPFVVKLETYLRMANITYTVDEEEPMGPKGKCPWVTLNGQEIADSQFIMEHLGSTFNKDFSDHLTPEQRATAHAFRKMIEDGFLWNLAHWRYVEAKGRPLLTGMYIPFYWRFALKGMHNKVKRTCWLQGIGRHTFSEIENIGRQDLAAISVFLGEKDFLMGDKPTEVDCAVFGILVQVLYASEGSPYLRMLQNDFPNLKEYCLRVRDKFWPDWDACLSSQ